MALCSGKRAFYTAPIKALVSEKFFGLVNMLGRENVGMITGDSQINPQAPVICCTAEILANQALREGEWSDVGCVARLNSISTATRPRLGLAGSAAYASACAVSSYERDVGRCFSNC